MIARPERHARRFRRLALLAARARGCTCVPDFVVVSQGDATHLRLDHDSWCPVLRQRPAIDLLALRDREDEA